MKKVKEEKMSKKLKNIICVLLCACILAAGAAGLSPAASAISDNEAVTARFLTETMGLNTAAVCGILANIEWESGFDPNLPGDKIDGVYTSYGLSLIHI